MTSKVRRTLVVGHHPKTGKPIEKNFCGPTKKAVQKKIDDYKRTQEQGYIPDIRLYDWINDWYDVYVTDNNYEMHKNNIRHIKNHFPDVNIRRVK